MAKTMQQIDHDAWEAGYGRNSGAVNAEHNSLELAAMYEALAARKRKEEQEEKQENKE